MMAMRRARRAARACARSRARSLPEAELIRFVAAPDGERGRRSEAKLPGRGVWVGLDRAIGGRGGEEERLRARPEAASASLPADLADQVAARLREAALGRLGLARKAGAAIGRLRQGGGGGRPRTSSRRCSSPPTRPRMAAARWSRRFAAASANAAPMPVVRGSSGGGIGFGNGPAKCDTCCRASGPGGQKFRGCGHPPPALRRRRAMAADDRGAAEPQDMMNE